MSLQQLGDLFNSFRKKENKTEAIQDVWKTFKSVTKLDVDVFQGNHNKFMSLAGDIVKSTARNVASAGGLSMAGLTEGLSVIPALFESVIESVIGLFGMDPPEKGFFPGEWITVHDGFIKETLQTEIERGAMFDDVADLGLEIPNYDVGFFIKYTDNERAVIFNAKKGKVQTVPDTDLRSVPDQDQLDKNEFLRDLKLLYFKKEGTAALAEGDSQIEIGKGVNFKDQLWRVLELEPVKQVVHLVKGNEIVKTALNTVKGFDQDNQLTWLTDLATESFPDTLVKLDFCWLTGDDNQELCVLKNLTNSDAEVVKCIDGTFHQVVPRSLHSVSDKLRNLLVKLPEFRRFRNDVRFGESKPMAIWSFRHLCTQSDVHRGVDTGDRVAIRKRFEEERKLWGTVDNDLGLKLKQFELAYNEKADVEFNETGYKIVGV